MIRFPRRSRHRNQQTTHPPVPDRHAPPPKPNTFSPRLAALNSFSRLGAAANHSFIALKSKSIPTTSHTPRPHPNANTHLNALTRDPPSPVPILINHQLHPSRNPAGHALPYQSYTPSRFFVPPASGPSRRPRQSSAQRSISSSALGLDFDSLARHPANFQPDFLPLHKRIRARIARLRQLIMHADRLGDLNMLKELVDLLQANIIRYQTEAVSKRTQIKHAKIVAGILDNRDNVIHIKKVPGKPKYFRTRPFTSAKNRAASMRSTSRHPRAPCEHNDRNKSSPPQTFCDKPAPKKANTDYSRLTRKSSAHLRRLHSAGAVLIRKLSKSSVSAQQQSSSCRSDRPTPAKPILDAEIIKKLKTNPMPIINEFQQELQTIEQEELLNRAKLQEAEAQLGERRETHQEIIEILDQFYGALPGWEQDPISQKMILETVELTEAGVDAERDLIEARDVCLRAKAALSDHERAQRALQAVRVDLTSFIQILRDLIASADVIVETRRRTSTDSSRRRYSVDVQTEAGEGVLDTLSQLERLLDRCVGQARMAEECCCEAPRVEGLRDDLEQIASGFGLEAEAVKKNNTIYYDDLEPTLQISVTALGDCKLAEAFVSERKGMIEEDLKPLEDQVERCEEYVILERIAILDLRHPRDDR